MENKNQLTELDALAQLSELLVTIETNNWNGIYSKIENELPFTPRTWRMQEEIDKLKKDIDEISGYNNNIAMQRNEAELKYKQMRIKLAAFKHLLKEIPD